MTSEPQSAIELKQILEILLENEIGTFSTGQKAFWIERPYIPQEVTVSGVQCIVQREPVFISSQLVFPKQSIQSMAWKACLTLFSRDFQDEIKFESAKDKIRGFFPRHEERPYPRNELTYPAIDFLLKFNRVTVPVQIISS